MLAEGVVGVQNVSKGATTKISLDGFGAPFVSELLPRYAALGLSGKLFYAVTSAYTIVSTTDISPLPGNTGVPILGIGNPLSSNSVFLLLKYGVATTSGTPGGPIIWNTVANFSTVTAAANGTVLPAFAGAPAKSAAKVYSATATTGSVAGVAHITASSVSAVAATGNTGSQLPIAEPVDGALGILPNNMLSLAATATGTSHVVSAWMLWAELDAGMLWG